MPIAIFPRLSLLTSAVVASSIVSGLAFGAFTAGLAVLAFGMRRS